MSSGELEKDYVISEDVNVLFSQWGDKNGITVPPSSFIKDLTNELCIEVNRATRCNVVLVTADELSEGLQHLAENSEYPVVSLDRVYIDKDTTGLEGHIDSTRAVDETHTKLNNLIPRPSFPLLTQQYERLRSDTISPITIADDVVYEGETVKNHIEALYKVNRPVEKVVAGIVIGDGESVLNECGIEVEYVRKFDQVQDEVCERDFFVGVPMSGRTVLMPNGDTYSAPYVEPLGDPEDWASIPSDAVRNFSMFCLKQAISLWSETKTRSGLWLPSNCIPRRVQALDSSEFIVSTLEKELIEYTQMEEERI